MTIDAPPPIFHRAYVFCARSQHSPPFCNTLRASIFAPPLGRCDIPLRVISFTHAISTRGHRSHAPSTATTPARAVEKTRAFRVVNTLTVASRVPATTVRNIAAAWKYGGAGWAASPAARRDDAGCAKNAACGLLPQCRRFCLAAGGEMRY